jgi:adenylate cyclase
MSQTRRLAAILAADVAGYSRQMGADEEGTLERLKALRHELLDPKIAEHHGRIVKTTGDGMLVEFASVVDAVRCAIAVQQAMPERNTGVAADSRIELRIGINLGDVIVEGDDLYGDGVNIAARIEALADAGGVLVSSTVHDQVRDRLPFVFEDLGEQQVKNIARPVRIYRIPIAIAGSAPMAKAPPPLPHKPSIAVLPFANLSGDPEQEYFADGMVEEIITALSHIRWLFVIARNSSFTYKGQAVDVKQVGRELGVRYVLEGSVRKAGNRVRITGQLIDATTGSHIWADRFDGALDDIFELQDQVASSVVSAIEPRLRHSEIERATRKPTKSLDAYDLYLRALAELYRSKEPIDYGEVAIELSRKALDIDPSYAPAAGLIAYIRMMQAALGARLSREDIAEALRLAKQALDRSNEDSDALWMGSFALALLAGEHSSALNALDRALVLNPNCARAWWASGAVNCFANRSGQAIAAIERAMRLSPLDPLGYLFEMIRGYALMLAGRYEEGMEWVDRSLHDGPSHHPTVRAKVALCGYLGRPREAREWVQRLLELNPGMTIAGFKSFGSKFLSPGTMAVWVEGFRLAGLPEK